MEYFKGGNKAKKKVDKNKKRTMQEVAQAKLEHYCAYQERCHHEVKQKLSDLSIWGEWAEEIIQHLINENFLSEERYAQSYARGKFRIKKWGRMKIRQKLREKRVASKLIDYGMKEIDEDEYLKTIEELIEKKNKTIRETNPIKRKKKLFNYMFTKGYESSLIWKEIKKQGF